MSDSGGEYSYLLEAFGPVPAFLYAWTSILIIKPSSFAIILLAFAAYIIEPFFPGCGDREDLVPLLKLLAAAAIGEFLSKNELQLYISKQVSNPNLSFDTLLLCRKIGFQKCIY